MESWRVHLEETVDVGVGRPEEQKVTLHDIRLVFAPMWTRDSAYFGSSAAQAPAVAV
jgi:hypothetical protein